MRSSTAHCSCPIDGPHRSRADRSARMTVFSWRGAYGNSSKSIKKKSRVLERFGQWNSRTWKWTGPIPRPYSLQCPGSVGHSRTAHAECTIAHCSPCYGKVSAFNFSRVLIMLLFRQSHSRSLLAYKRPRLLTCPWPLLGADINPGVAVAAQSSSGAISCIFDPEPMCCLANRMSGPNS